MKMQISHPGEAVADFSLFPIKSEMPKFPILEDETYWRGTFARRWRVSSSGQ
jgi:hypothetical protein